jgi:hypothetical protein
MSVCRVVLRLVLLGGFLLPGSLASLQAQITGQIEAQIPFSFVVADTTLEPGNYVIRPLGGDDPAMEVRRAEGGKAVNVLITRAVSSNLPPKTELLFNRYADQEFLAKVLVEGNHEKAEIEPCRLESKLKREGQRAQIHVLPAKHRQATLDPS